jgi:hypothetical protein
MSDLTKAHQSIIYHVINLPSQVDTVIFHAYFTQIAVPFLASAS